MMKPREQVPIPIFRKTLVKLHGNHYYRDWYLINYKKGFIKRVGKYKVYNEDAGGSYWPYHYWVTELGWLSDEFWHPILKPSKEDLNKLIKFDDGKNNYFIKHKYIDLDTYKMSLSSQKFKSQDGREYKKTDCIPKKSQRYLTDKNGNRLFEIDGSSFQVSFLVDKCKKSCIKLDDDFIEWTNKGVIYLKLAEKLDVTIKSAKSLLIRFINGANFRSEWQDDRLERLFPLLYKWRSTVKDEWAYINKKKKWDWRSSLCAEYTNWEGDIMRSSLRKHVGNILMLDKHDAVFVKSEDVQLVIESLDKICSDKDLQCCFKITNPYTNKTNKVTFNQQQNYLSIKT